MNDNRSLILREDNFNPPMDVTETEIGKLFLQPKGSKWCLLTCTLNITILKNKLDITSGEDIFSVFQKIFKSVGPSTKILYFTSPYKVWCMREVFQDLGIICKLSSKFSTDLSIFFVKYQGFEHACIAYKNGNDSKVHVFNPGLGKNQKNFKGGEVIKQNNSFFYHHPTNKKDFEIDNTIYNIS